MEDQEETKQIIQQPLFQNEFKNKDEILIEVKEENYFQTNYDKNLSLYYAEDLLWKEANFNKNSQWKIKCHKDKIILYPWHFSYEEKKENQNQDSEIQQQIHQNQIILTHLDLLGAITEEINLDKKTKIYQLSIFTFKIYPTSCCFCCCKGTKRRLKEYTFYHQNQEKLEIWKNLIQFVSQQLNFMQQNQNLIQSKKLLKFQQEFLVFVNPAGGSGTSQAVWAQAKRYLQIAGYTFNEILTQRRFHAQDYCREMQEKELQSYVGLITVSGDGLPHEIINGLYQNPHKELARRIPLGPLPGGSGNAIVKNLTHCSKEEFTVEAMSYIIAKHKFQEVDLIELELDSQKQKIYSFLSLTYAFIADCDLNSEHLRCLGGLRFDVYGTYRALCQRSYNCQLYFSQKSYDVPPINEKFKNMHDFMYIDKPVKYFTLSNMPFIGGSTHCSPLSKINDQHIDLQMMHSEEGWWKFVKFAIDFSSGAHIDVHNQKVHDGYPVMYHKIKSFRLHLVESLEQKEWHQEVLEKQIQKEDKFQMDLSLQPQQFDENYMGQGKEAEEEQKYIQDSKNQQQEQKQQINLQLDINEEKQQQQEFYQQQQQDNISNSNNDQNNNNHHDQSQETAQDIRNMGMISIDGERFYAKIVQGRAIPRGIKMFCYSEIDE